MPFSARTRCVAPFPRQRAAALGCRAFPRLFDACFLSHDGALLRRRGGAQRSAVPAPHPPHVLCSMARLLGLVPLVFRTHRVHLPAPLCHIFCPETIPHMPIAMATN